MKILIILAIFLLVLTAGCVSTFDSEKQIDKKYMGYDPEACKSMFFTCEINERPFYDENGCGCAIG